MRGEIVGHIMNNNGATNNIRNGESVGYKRQICPIAAKHQGRHITCMLGMKRVIGVIVSFAARKIYSAATVTFMYMKPEKVSGCLRQAMDVGNNEHTIRFLVKFYDASNGGCGVFAVNKGNCLRSITVTLHIHHPITLYAFLHDVVIPILPKIKSREFLIFCQNFATKEF